jgi:hypothetical protein
VKYGHASSWLARDVVEEPAVDFVGPETPMRSAATTMHVIAVNIHPTVRAVGQPTSGRSIRPDALPHLTPSGCQTPLVRGTNKTVRAAWPA